MGEEAPRERRRVERRVLVEGARGQPQLHQLRRRDRARRHQRRETRLGQALDQRQQRQRFTDARAMQPDQRPLRALAPAGAATFVEPPGIFLAASQAKRQQRARDRGRRPGR